MTNVAGLDTGVELARILEEKGAKVAIKARKYAKGKMVKAEDIPLAMKKRRIYPK